MLYLGITQQCFLKCGLHEEESREGELLGMKQWSYVARVMPLMERKMCKSEYKCIVLKCAYTIHVSRRLSDFQNKMYFAYSNR